MTQTLPEAIQAAGPSWLPMWLNILMFGGFILPIALLIWQQSRRVAIAALIAAVASGFGVGWMYDHLGYVRLLGLPHILFWTPLAIVLWQNIKRADMPSWPRGIMWVVLAVVAISLAFDYIDVLRYIMGTRDIIV